MNLKKILSKCRRALLCCGAEEKNHSLDISSPTNIRKGVLDIPGLTEEQRAFIREKASTDARLMSLSSHPPTRPPSFPPSSVPLPTPSRSPSVTLLNSASSNLPSTLPTPPRQKHTDSAPSSSAHNRMKGFWECTRRHNNTLRTHSNIGYHDLKADGADRDEGVVLLGFDFKELEPDSPVSAKTSVEGFEPQDVMGGGQETVDMKDSNEKRTGDLATEPVIQGTEDGSSTSGSDDDDGRSTAFDFGERKPLVKPNQAA
ncbi:hypothetical protein B0J11DRAFT_504250 [Dendryphion nanum]|uniref:Uncharacterized protein n=1 Tax=Dendryphion nanum TaxID=256645 RepID=A0A9P9E4G0_9PLEO|nr:hypothetical protein B0J11DRAFT_504250 [Dendryphion nanum]